MKNVEIEYGKLSVLLATVIVAGVALANGHLSETAFLAIVGPVIGYIFGNGKLALKGKPTVPTIGAKTEAPPPDVPQDPPAAA